MHNIFKFEIHERLLEIYSPIHRSRDNKHLSSAQILSRLEQTTNLQRRDMSHREQHMT